MESSVINFFKKLYGGFSKEELFKFLKLGVILGVIMSLYRAVAPLKDSWFLGLVGAEFKPYAPLIVSIALIPIVVLYSKLVEKFSRRHLFYIISGAYGLTSILLGLLMMIPGVGSVGMDPNPWNLLGWLIFIFVESFVLVLGVLLWAFSADITTDRSGRRGFPVIVITGEIVVRLLSYILRRFFLLINKLIAPSVVLGALGVCILVIIPLISYFFKSTPKYLLAGFGELKPSPDNAPADYQSSGQSSSGLFEGLRLMLVQPYLLGILFLLLFFKTIVGVFGYYYLKLLASVELTDIAARVYFFGSYALWVNSAMILLILLGINNITRRLGVRVALSVTPILVALGVGAFFYSLALGVLNILFWAMVIAKGVNFALNMPAIQQLYIPLSDAARYKSQAWIAVFFKAIITIVSLLHDKIIMVFYGSVSSYRAYIKEALYPVKEVHTWWCVVLFGVVFLAICAIWLFFALYLGKKYNQAIQSSKIIC